MYHKKFYLFLLAVITVFVLMFIYEIKETKDIDITPSEKPLVNHNPTSIPLDASDPILGNPGAPLTIVEFVDFNCADCRAAHATIYDFAVKHPKDVRVFLKDAPASHLFSSIDGKAAHRAAFCAGKQKKYWEFVNLITQDTNNLRTAGLQKSAEALNLNLLAWKKCLESAEAKQKIEASVEVAEMIGVDKLPAVFANNKQIDLTAGADLKEILEKMITP